jgi:hypothetical protein
MVLPLTITVVACLVVGYLVKPVIERDAHNIPQPIPHRMVVAARLSMLAAIIIGGWSAFVLATIALKNWIA